MNRHVRIPTIFLWFALACGCEGTEGSVFLDRNPVSTDSGSALDGKVELDASTSADSGHVPDAGPDFDGAVEPDGSTSGDGGHETDGAVEQDGSVLGDGGDVDSGAPNVDCTQNPPVFPSFDRSCGSAADCSVGVVQIDCCGSLTATGINSAEEARFAAAAALCNSQFPGCGCASQPTRADDGTTEINSSPVIVQCVANTCQTTFPPNPTVCGGNLSCDPATSVCVATSPIGPAIDYACEPIPSGCEQDRTCSCAGASLCTPPFTACSEQGPNQISCECLLCQ